MDEKLKAKIAEREQGLKNLEQEDQVLANQIAQANKRRSEIRDSYLATRGSLEELKMLLAGTDQPVVEESAPVEDQPASEETESEPETPEQA